MYSRTYVKDILQLNKPYRRKKNQNHFPMLSPMSRVLLGHLVFFKPTNLEFSSFFFNFFCFSGVTLCTVCY